MATASKVINISLPEALLREIDLAAAAESRTRSDFLREAARRYMSDRRWRQLQTVGAERARALGLEDEDDVEEFLDALPD